MPGNQSIKPNNSNRTDPRTKPDHKEKLLDRLREGNDSRMT
jgi:hypothetical protein